MVSAYLEAVAQAREQRDETGRANETAQANLVAALARAHQHHSLREIAPYAGMTYAGVAWLIKQQTKDTP